MINTLKLKKMATSFHKNVIVKKKYKSFLMAIVNPNMRRDLNRMYELTKNCTRTDLKSIPVNSLRHGHQVVYPDYALSLFAGAKDLPRIRVVYDPARDVYVVVDGNHRLPALLTYARHSNYEYIECEVLS